MGSFVQVIEFSSSHIDEIKALGEKMRANRDGSTGPTRAIFTEDRDRPGHYLNIIEFESYEKAMENSNHPATQEFAQQISKLMDGTPAFYNLNVMDRWDG